MPTQISARSAFLGLQALCASDFDARTRQELVDAVNLLWQHQVLAYYGNWYLDLRRDVWPLPEPAEYGLDELRACLVLLGAKPNPFSYPDPYPPAFLRAMGLYVSALDRATGCRMANLALEREHELAEAPAVASARAFLQAAGGLKLARVA